MGEPQGRSLKAWRGLHCGTGPAPSAGFGSGDGARAARQPGRGRRVATAGVKWLVIGQFENVARKGDGGPVPSRHAAKKTVIQRDTEEDARRSPALPLRPFSCTFGTALTRVAGAGDGCGRNAAGAGPDPSWHAPSTAWSALAAYGPPRGRRVRARQRRESALAAYGPPRGRRVRARQRRESIVDVACAPPHAALGGPNGFRGRFVLA